MKTVYTYDEFVNEEINLKKTAAMAALGAGLAFGSPDFAKGQDTQQIVEPVKTEQGIKQDSISSDTIDLSFERYSKILYGQYVNNMKNAGIKYEHDYNRWAPEWEDRVLKSYSGWVTYQLEEMNIKNSPSVDTLLYNASYKPTINTNNVQRVTTITNKILSPGDYMIKGTNQILTGLGFGAGAILVQYIPISPTNTNFENATKTKATVGIILGLVGVGFEISGILNIQKAGILLNENGIGIKIPIK